MGRGAGAGLHTHRPAGRHPHLQPHAAPPPTAPASAPTVQPPPRGDLSRMHGPRYVPGSGLHASQEPPVSLVPGCVATRLCGRWLAWPSSASCICSLRSATNTPKPTVLPPDCDGPQTHVSVGAPAVGPPQLPARGAVIWSFASHSPAFYKNVRFPADRVPHPHGGESCPRELQGHLLGEPMGAVQRTWPARLEGGGRCW